MKLVFWISVLTDHQSHLLRALVRHGAEVVVVVGTSEIAERREQGWTPPDITGLDVRPLSPGWLRTISDLVSRHRDAIHVFGGLLSDRRFVVAMLCAQRRGVRTALLSEPYAETPVAYFSARPGWRDRLKSRLRPLIYRSLGVLFGRGTVAIFAISDLAAEQFARAGFRGECYRFGYFVPRTETAAPSRDPDRVRVVFVGALVARKGIRVLLDGFARARAQLGAAGEKLGLDIYGPGALEAPPAGARLLGPIRFGTAQGVIAAYDVLVLPSLHDGWGVVVNEALLQGVPALVSDAVGAKAPVARAKAGAIFPAGDADALAALFVDAVRLPGRLDAWKAGARAIAPMLEPDVAARYLLDCLRHAEGGASVPPSAPWYPE